MTLCIRTETLFRMSLHKFKSYTVCSLEFRIAWNGLGPDNCADIVRIIKNSKKLKLLEYVAVMFVVHMILSDVNPFGTFCELSISKNPVGDNGFVQIVDCLEELGDTTSLRKLG